MNDVSFLSKLETIEVPLYRIIHLLNQNLYGCMIYSALKLSICRNDLQILKLALYVYLLYSNAMFSLRDPQTWNLEFSSAGFPDLRTARVLESLNSVLPVRNKEET